MVKVGVEIKQKSFKQPALDDSKDKKEKKNTSKKTEKKRTLRQEEDFLKGCVVPEAK